ncbi:hypothetical protein OHA_1_00037 [Pleomorphomonas sp. SM30]|uniref:Uncharacterized protein n=1 Tax=Oharaeibacter diazotrophicus TaxID=1920512 RepID=A0A4R6RLP3_9HYPH|nr:hypothetical protein EDD54_1480 [Oharaeibacter diazotrophicus]BBE70475.1 hypothetical protein OHA_1_00037 [Pleomorphomonas sp. SM30]GLS77219.1 hypothetical protein GCM10007904_25560 [Oharaeibacter diazotrophicus]
MAKNDASAKEPARSTVGLEVGSRNVRARIRTSVDFAVETIRTLGDGPQSNFSFACPVSGR